MWLVNLYNKLISYLRCPIAAVLAAVLIAVLAAVLIAVLVAGNAGNAVALGAPDARKKGAADQGA